MSTRAEIAGMSGSSEIESRLQQLRSVYHEGQREHVVLDDICVDFVRGESVGIVGESGSGKSTLARALIRLQKAQGDIQLLGQDIQQLSAKELRQLRRRMQIVFQDPYGSLSPRMSVAEIIGEGLEVHEPQILPAERREKVADVLAEVGLNAPMMDRYPHEFSGRQRQRISIARALVLKPDFIVLDEPTSALDVSVQAQIVELLRDLQDRHGLTYVFISHDLKVVRALAHHVKVMRAGEVVEVGPAAAVFDSPQSPYTQALMKAAFLMETDAKGAVAS